MFVSVCQAACGSYARPIPSCPSVARDRSAALNYVQSQAVSRILRCHAPGEAI